MLTKTKKSVYSLAFVLLCFLAGCSAVPQLDNNAKDPIVKLPKNNQELGIMSAYSDPWEGFNRRVYYFNAMADEYVILPVVQSYKKITPDIVETGISNFFNNLGEISTFINSLLQVKIVVAAETLTRFTVNSTLGLAGLFDVASEAGLREQNEDFGQTLGFWGVDAGPYLVLPLLGPSSLRDASGIAFDSLTYQQAIEQFGMNTDEEFIMTLMESIDKRARLPFRYYASGSAFEYDQLKLLYKKYREIQVAR